MTLVVTHVEQAPGCLLCPLNCQITVDSIIKLMYVDKNAHLINECVGHRNMDKLRMTSKMK